MLLLKWKTYCLDNKILEFSLIWFNKLNKNWNKFLFNLKIFIKNEYLRDNINLKLLSYYIFSFYNFKITPKILETKKNILSLKIRKQSSRGFILYFKKFKKLRLLNFLNYQKVKLNPDSKIGNNYLIGNLHNLFNISKLKFFTIGNTTKILTTKVQFYFKNIYKFNLITHILFMQRFNIFNKDIEQVLEQTKFWENFESFNKIMNVKLILNKLFNINLFYNIKTWHRTQKYKLFNYPIFKLLDNETRYDIKFLKGQIAVENILTTSLSNKIISNNFDLKEKKLSFIYMNKKMLRLQNYVEYFNLLNSNKIVINFLLLPIIKLYFNFFELIKYKV